MKTLISTTIFLILVTLTSAFSAEKFLKKTEKKDEVEIKYYDLNSDEKIDRIEYWRSSLLEKVHTDKYFSGQINEWIQYRVYKNDVTPVEIIESDTNKDQKADRKKTIYRNEKEKLWLTVNEVDSDFDGKFDKTFNTHADLIQHTDQAHCDPEISKFESKFLKLAADSTKIGKAIDKEDYLQTDFGYKIQRDCMKNWGESFPQLLKESITAGMKCLEKLSRDNDRNGVSPNGAFSNLRNLDHIIANQGVTIACNQTEYDWSGTAAHASVKPGETLKGLPIKHPYMSLNPKDPKQKGKATQEETEYMRKTLFHEQLHNLGILHEESIEAPYTCEICCFPEGTETAEVEAACKICAGGYTSTTDKRYIKDMMAWGGASYIHKKRVFTAIVNFQKEFPNDRFGLLSFAEMSSDVFNPLGSDIATIVKNRFSDLTPEEKEKIKKMEELKDYELFRNPRIKKSSATLAEAFVANMFDRDPKKMLNLIRRDRVTFKALIDEAARAENREGNEKYVLSGLKDQLSNMLKDVWLKDPPGKSSQEGDTAYDLLKEFKLLRKL